MSVIKRKNGAFHDLVFQVDLRDYGKTNADITEITFIVKEKITDADPGILRKRLSQTEIVASPDTAGTVIQVSVEWTESDYTGFVIGQEYPAGLFIQFTGDPNHDENVDETFTVIIEEDFIDA